MHASTTSTLRGDRQKADVIPFAHAAPRRFRRDSTEADVMLGQILLFTGVRYERMPETDDAPLPQRKRS